MDTVEVGAEDILPRQFKPFKLWIKISTHDDAQVVRKMFNTSITTGPGFEKARATRDALVALLNDRAK